MDWTTNGTTNPVAESGTVWIALVLGGIVAGNNVCGYIWLNVCLDRLRGKMNAEADNCGIHATRHLTWVRTNARW